MEFEPNNNTPQTASISDAERLAATTRRLELTPVHTDVKADELPDDVVATQHIVQGALGNIPNESEATNPAAAIRQPQQSPRRKSIHIALTAGITVAIIAAGASYYFFTQQ